jgi:hypothetical protein
MKLRSLTIELHTYGDHAGKYTGEVKYEHEQGATTLTFDESLSERLLEFIGPVLTLASQKVSAELEKAIQVSLTEARALKAIEA